MTTLRAFTCDDLFRFNNIILPTGQSISSLQRVSNQVAVNMYKQLGYSVYRTVIEYYSASNGELDEDAYDMRKALSRDTEKKSIIPLPHPVRPEDIE
ncbi:N-alpha-acetyltransferase 20 [Sigmodon hispidus]